MPRVEDFLSSVLPPHGPYVLAYKTKPMDGLAHKVYNTYAAIAKATPKLVGYEADTWICIGSILDPNFVSDKGKKVPRNQKNMKALKSLVLDLDVSAKDGYYHSKEDAIAGLFAFQQALGFPDPAVIDSGYGFHVWWPFDAAIEPNDWIRLANKLKTVARSIDPRLVADPTRVADSAGLLRIPGTQNFKAKPAVPTSILSLNSEALGHEVYNEKLTAYVESHGLEVKSPKAKDSKVNNMLSLYLDEPHDLKTILKKCNWLKHYALNQSKATEPEWYATLGVVPYVRIKELDTLDIAEFLSKGHPEYSRDLTDKKLRQVQSAQDGPTTCERFRMLNPKHCENCLFARLVNTPVRLDVVDLPAPAPEVAEEIIKESGESVTEIRQLLSPPFPYFRGKESGGIYMKVGEGDEANVRRIYEYDIFPVRRLKDEENDNEMLEISLTLPMDGHRLIKLANGLLTDPKKLTAELANKGVLVQTKEAPHLTAYIIEYARKIQREEKAHEEFARFGWRDIDGENPRFVLGDFVVNHKGELRRATPAPYLKGVRDAISVKGALEDWRSGFNVYAGMPGNEPLKFALMMAFAAPLLALTEFHGMMYNMIGSSGCGKSTALKIMSSVWGRPDEHHIKVNDNVIPMYNTLGYLQSIPVTFDELTTIASDTLADIAYNITEGRGKHRADRSGNTRANTVQWKTIVVGSSNSSLYEKLGMSRSGNNAHTYRIFEVEVGAADTKNRSAIDVALNRVGANYGIAGRVFIIYVLKNLPEIKKLLIEKSIEFATRFKMPTAERFWFTLFSCMSVGGTIAKALGLHDYDIEEIVNWNVLELTKVREAVSRVEGDAFSSLSHFLSINAASTILVKDNKANALDLSGNLRSLLIRLEMENGKPTYGYIAMNAFKDYCKQTMTEYSWLVKRLQDTGLFLGLETKALGEGSNMRIGSGKCWKMDLQHPMMQDKTS